MYRTVITFGTFDLFHIGHLNILKRSAEFGRKLVVGVSTDALNFSKKGRYPVIPQEERMELVRCCRYVDQVFYEESLDLKRQYILDAKADCLVMGNDWKGKFDEFNDICDVRYLDRTDNISTTYLEKFIRERDSAVLAEARSITPSTVPPPWLREPSNRRDLAPDKR